MNMLRFFNPEITQGNLHKSNYFEGWYYKLILADEHRLIAVIPGFSSADGDRHAFIQFIESETNTTRYIRFPPDCFHSSGKDLRIDIGKNSFSADGIRLNLEEAGFSLKGDLDFTNIVPFPKKFLYRGIMGPFGYLPFMECYHGVVNIRHRILGHLLLNGKTLDFNGGTGYVEKDWGSSFPSAWIWIQANFLESDTVFMLSIAKIPYLGHKFCGIISFVYHEGRYYSLATYNGTKIKSFGHCAKKISITLENRQYTLNIDIDPSSGGMLKAPAHGAMERTIEETLRASLSIRLREKNGITIFEGNNNFAGMEISGDIDALLNS